MKKRALLVAAIAAGIFTSLEVNAQDFKPEAGAKNIEVNFTPFGNQPIDINSLRFRYFMNSDFAIRVGIHINSVSTEDTDGVSQEAIDLSGITGAVITNYETSEFEFGIDVGFEKHWAGTDRLSPYWGAEVGFGSVSTKESATFDGTIDGEFTTDAILFGANLLIGADFYFAPKFYFGTEIGFGFIYASTGDIENTIGTYNSKDEGPSSFAIGEDVNSAVRVGFIF